MGIVNGLYNLGGTVEYSIPLKFSLDNILIKKKSNYYSIKQGFDGKTILNTFRGEAAGRPIYFTYELDSVGCNNVPYLDSNGNIVKNYNDCSYYTSSNDNVYATLIVPILDRHTFDRYPPYFMSRYTTGIVRRTGECFRASGDSRIVVLRHVVDASECDYYGSSSSGLSGYSAYFPGTDTRSPDDPEIRQYILSSNGNVPGGIEDAYIKRLQSITYYSYRPEDIDELWLSITFPRAGNNTVDPGIMIGDNTSSITFEDLRLKLTRYNAYYAHFDN